jgi:NAD(P)-dependent dehydrogenase (short-subunit alcohol dehydrogenase family)
MAVTLVLGASRGLGLALTQAYAAQGRSVVATVRSEADRERVEATGAKVLRVDVADPASVSGLAWQLDGEKIELALYVAGLWDAQGSATPPTR